MISKISEHYYFVDLKYAMKWFDDESSAYKLTHAKLRGDVKLVPEELELHMKANKYNL